MDNWKQQVENSKNAKYEKDCIILRIGIAPRELRRERPDLQHTAPRPRHCNGDYGMVAARRRCGGSHRIPRGSVRHDDHGKRAAFTLPGLFEPGDVEVLAYNLPAGVSIHGGIATVNTGADGTLLVPDAGVLFSGVATTHVVADDTARVTLAMQQRMREVRFTLTVTDGDPERITAIEARLDGVAASIDLRTGEVTGNTASVMLSFVRKDNKLTANLWIVGIATGAKQQIVTTLTFSDGNRTETHCRRDRHLPQFQRGQTHPAGCYGQPLRSRGCRTGRNHHRLEAG